MNVVEEISETERGEMQEGETVSGARISTQCRHYVITPRGWHASRGKRICFSQFDFISNLKLQDRFRWTGLDRLVRRHDL